MAGRTHELIVIAGHTAGAVVMLLAATFALLGPDSVQSLALGLGAAAIAGVAGAAAVGFDLDRLHRVDAGEGARYERQRRTLRLRGATILLRLLVLLGFLFIVGFLLARTSVIDLRLSEPVLRRGAAVHALVLAVTAGYCHHQALHVDAVREQTEVRRASVILLAVVATGLAVAAALTRTGFGLPGDEVIELPAQWLFATLLMGAAVIVARDLPTLAQAIVEPTRLAAGGVRAGGRGALTPTVVALTILAAFGLLLVLISAGFLSVLQQAGQSTALLVSLIILLAAVIAGVTVSLRLARQDDRPTLYRETTRREVREERLVLGVSLPLGAVLILLGVFVQAQDGAFGLPGSAWLHVLSLGILLSLGPYGFYVAAQQRRIRSMEERFPDFLRDLASSHQGGLTLNAAIHVAARGDYGPLSPEVQKMADQLTWNISFDEALGRFAERVRTPLVRRTVSLILEASRSGGNTTDVLRAAARDAREIKTLERKRRLNMSVYTMVIYVVFFVFLFVIAVLYDQFVPEILAAGEAQRESGIQGIGGLDLGGVTLDDYQTFYFLAGVVQGIGNGILAGVMGSGKALLGLRHGFWMVLFTYLTFVIL